MCGFVGPRGCFGSNRGMDANELFKTALGLQPPWEVASLDFDPGKRRLDIRVDFQRGSFFPCPVCGSLSKAHDTEERTWRHLDFFQHAAYLPARVPRCNCDEHGIKTVDVPWARKGSGFTGPGVVSYIFGKEPRASRFAHYVTWKRPNPSRGETRGFP